MSEHITQWLEAYYDGELPTRQARQVEAHLETCDACLVEYESLDHLSTLLQRAPEPANLTPSETFAAQVGLRLPRKPEQTSWQKALQTGWHWVPIGLLGAWVFVQTTFIVSGILMWLLRLAPSASAFAGLLPVETSGTSLLNEATNLTGADWTELGSFSLNLLRGGGPLGWGITLNLGLTLILGLLFMSWLASWWVQKSNGDQRPLQQ